MNPILIKEFIQSNLTTKGITDADGKVTLRGKAFLIQNGLLEIYCPRILFDNDRVITIGCPNELKNPNDLYREIINPNKWISLRYIDITPNILYNFCHIFDILAKEPHTGYDVIDELGGDWSISDCPAGIPIMTFLQEQSERSKHRRFAMLEIRRHIERCNIFNKKHIDEYLYDDFLTESRKDYFRKEYSNFLNDIHKINLTVSLEEPEPDINFNSPEWTEVKL